MGDGGFVQIDHLNENAQSTHFFSAGFRGLVGPCKDQQRLFDKVACLVQGKSDPEHFNVYLLGYMSACGFMFDEMVLLPSSRLNNFVLNRVMLPLSCEANIFVIVLRN